MARTRKDARINTRSARTSLQQRKEPYWRSISKGLAVGYYKGATSGAWIAKHFSTATGRRKASLGVADDFEDADGIRVLSFDQAQAKARDWATLKAQEDTGEIQAGAFTVAQAMAEYLAHLTKAKRKPQGRTAAIVKAFVLPTLGNIELSKLTHGKSRHGGTHSQRQRHACALNRAKNRHIVRLIQMTHCKLGSAKQPRIAF